MDQKYKYSLESAMEADKKGELFQWAQDYLRGEGMNVFLADHLVVQKPTIVVLKKFPLNRLKRIVGPEEGMMFFEEKDKWEKRVASLIGSIKKEVQFPPLLVTDFWNPLGLADGGHRFEALNRSGVESYWTIFFFRNTESLRQIEKVED